MSKSAKTKQPKQDFQKLSEEYLANWQLAQADLENFKKESAKKQPEIYLQAQMNALIPLLELADNFQAMANHVPGDIEDNAWVTGVLHIAKQLDDLLETQGLEKVDPKNKKFNPEMHEAIETIEDKNKTSGQVLEVVQVGYKLADRLLRPAKVKVVQ